MDNTNKEHKLNKASALKKLKKILPRSFRRLPITIKRHILSALFDVPVYPEHEEMLQLADVMVESAIGYTHVPMGVASGFLIDGHHYDIPMATEEPSVIAAANYIAAYVRRFGGFSTSGSRSIMSAQVFLEHISLSKLDDQAWRKVVDTQLQKLCTSIKRHGGGLHDSHHYFIPCEGVDMAHHPSHSTNSKNEVWCFEFFVDVCDSMGANLLNEAAEQISPVLEEQLEGKKLMAIVSNAAQQRIANASFRIPLNKIRSRGGFSGIEIARRIVMASQVAHHDVGRAITHNKGILNSISAAALATGNDTRGVEAAIHAYAARDGQYRGLSTYRIEQGELCGTIVLPMPIATVGGAVGVHPSTQIAMRLLDNISAPQFARVLAALGLAQNFAALMALVTEGIQQGHMGLHAMRLAWKVGARGKEIIEIARKLAYKKDKNLEQARQILEELRNSDYRLPIQH